MRLFRRAASTISALPGVEHVAYGNMPMSSGNPTPIYPEGAVSVDGEHEASFYNVSREYFHTLRMPLVQGRFFDGADTTDSPRVAVVNQTFARRVLRSNDPVGRRFHLLSANGPLVERRGTLANVPRGKRLALKVWSPHPRF